MGELNRFNLYVDKKGPDECWPWTGGTNGNGYGRFKRDKKNEFRTEYAHRFALQVKLGRGLKEGMVAMHTCDNPLCVNPNHLVEGTQGDNVQDAKDKGRLNPAKGESQRSARLTERDVLDIRAEPDEVTNTELAERYGVKQHTISNARSGVTWKHVPMPDNVTPTHDPNDFDEVDEDLTGAPDENFDDETCHTDEVRHGGVTIKRDSPE